MGLLAADGVEEGSHARRQRLLAQFLATCPKIPHRVRDAFTLVDAGRVELFRSGATVGAVIREPAREGTPVGYTIVQPDHCRCADRQAWPSQKCVHLLALEIVEALVQ